MGCGGGGSEDTETPNPIEPITNSLSLKIERVSSSPFDLIKVSVTVKENDQLKVGVSSEIVLTIQKGEVGQITEVSTGIYEFTVTPNNSGEYPLTVGYKDVSQTETPLVFRVVDDSWGQPMSVSGLVNTEGYEDGITITPDGEYLFVQYGPIYFSGIILFNIARENGGCGSHRLEFPIGTANRCSHQWIDEIIGPVSGPERPGFFDGRFNNNTMLHNANSWGVGNEESPIFAPMTMFYGFKRQDDGSFREPFYLAFEDENDAIANPAGLSFLLNDDSRATIVFFLNDADPSGVADINGDGSEIVDSLHDIFTSEITFGVNNNLGTYVATGTAGTPPIRSSSFFSTLVGFDTTGIKGIAGTQGNPYLFSEQGVIRSIWTDDEFDNPDLDLVDLDGDYGDISVYLLTNGEFPNGEWSKLTLPSKVNIAHPTSEIQPYFSGDGLFFTRSSDQLLPEIHFASYSGGQTESELIDNNNWSESNIILSSGESTAVGQIIAIGEPTIASYQGDTYLYFVYGVIRAFDSESGLADINMQAGFIKKRQ